MFWQKKFQFEIWKDQFLKKKYRKTLIEKGSADIFFKKEKESGIWKKKFIMSDIYFIESSKNTFVHVNKNSLRFFENRRISVRNIW